MNFAIIGLGYWGANYIRIINELDETSLLYCCDLQDSKLSKYKLLLKDITITKNYKDILRDKEVSSVIIATPPNSHTEIIEDCLNAKKNVLVEKPITLSPADAKRLHNTAIKNNVKLMVGHTYVYNPGILKIKQYIDSGELGEILYGFSLRLGLSPIRKSASALWDLATHDITILRYLFGTPRSVICTGESYLQKQIEDYVNLVFQYENKINISIYASWFCPEKIRKFTIIGTKKMLIFDDVNKSEMIKLFERSLDMQLLNTDPTYIDHQNIVRQGGIQIPYVQQSEPLKNQVIHFVEAIKADKSPLTDGLEGLEVVKIINAAQDSIRGNGIKVSID